MVINYFLQECPPRACKMSCRRIKRLTKVKGHFKGIRRRKSQRSVNHLRLLNASLQPYALHSIFFLIKHSFVYPILA